MKSNYYAIHKNKKPKRLFRKSKKKPNPHIAIAIAIAVIGATQMSILQSRPIPAYKKGGISFNENNQSHENHKEKGRILAETLIHTAKSIAKELNKAARYEFLRRGHYIRVNKPKQL